MKKLIIVGALVLLLVPASVGAAAWYVNKWSTHVLNVGNCPDRGMAACVSTFSDDGNSCYVLQRNEKYMDYPVSISCVRGE